jgi:hypothetical protein
MNQVSFFIDLLNKDPGSPKVREDHIAAQLKKAFAEVIAVARLPGNMELHFRPTIHGTHAITAFPASQ